jgi:pimeloyl-ACP methyl ester carboxylesterase
VRTVSLAVAAMVIAACSPAGDVSTERIDRVVPSAPDDRSTAGELIAGEPIVWGACDEFVTLAAAEPAAAGWECGTLVVPMDPADPSAPLDEVVLAVTRHPAVGDRQGALLVNPGGPGVSGLQAAWSLRPDLPIEVLLRFDIVSWDPRGVGASSPAIDCGPAPDLDDPGVMADCSTATGDLAGFLSAPYSAADMEAIRVALGEERLDYLGYSYGSALGASYAAQFPDSVGSFVLDGVIDPLAGSRAGVYDGGFPFYAADGTEAAAERFFELCGSTERCLPGTTDAEGDIDALRDVIGRLPTEAFDPHPQAVDGLMLDDVLADALLDSRSWPLVVTGLDDGRMGDASTLAALSAAVSPDPSRQAEAGSPATDFQVANLVIYCADFARVIDRSAFCDALPTGRPLTPVVAVDTDRPILVVGTEFDPATPGRHAAEFSAALGDSVHVMWEGVGHAVFPGTSGCIDEVVSAYLLTGQLPADGTRCAFVDGVSDGRDLADALFTIDHWSATAALVDALRGNGSLEPDDDAACIADELARRDTRIVTHLLLDVRSAVATAALAAARSVC